MSLPPDARSHRRDSLESLEKQLICPICLEIFTKPVVILPCLHNLCRKCANELYQVGVGGRFRCPSCRHEVVLDRHGVYGLQRNLLVENIIDVYQQESARSDQKSSKPPPKPPAQLTCEEHDDEKLNIYCITCQVPSCSLCKVFGAHKNCQVAPLSDVYEQQKIELQEGVASLVSKNDRVQAFINELEEICRNIEENSRIQKQMLCEKFDRMSAILEERRTSMTQQITGEEEEKAGWAQSLVQTYSGHVDTNSELVQAAVTAMEESETAAFVQTSKDLIEKVSRASTCFTLETVEPGYENMDHYRVDFNAEERVLYQLDFIKLEEEVEDTPDEPMAEPEPECEPDPVPTPEPDPVPTPEPDPVPTPEPDLEPHQGIKSEDSEISSLMPETIENTWGHAEQYADAIKEPVCERNGFSTQQNQGKLAYEEHDAGDLGIQSLLAEAGEALPQLVHVKQLAGCHPHSLLPGLPGHLAANVGKYSGPNLYIVEVKMLSHQTGTSVSSALEGLSQSAVTSESTHLSFSFLLPKDATAEFC